MTAKIDTSLEDALRGAEATLAGLQRELRANPAKLQAARLAADFDTAAELERRAKELPRRIEYAEVLHLELRFKFLEPQEKAEAAERDAAAHALALEMQALGEERATLQRQVRELEKRILEVYERRQAVLNKRYPAIEERPLLYVDGQRRRWRLEHAVVEG